MVEPRDAGRSVQSQALFSHGRPEPGAHAPATERLAWLLGVQADACEAMGSPLYGHLLARAGQDAAAGGPVADLLAAQVTSGRSDALALRFLAAVHRLVLTGRAQELAEYYPSAGGDRPPSGAWPALRALLAARGDELARLIPLPCQTNEVGRCAGLAWGLLGLARSGLALRLLEVGSSGGLLLRWDHYRYGGAGVTAGPADSPVNLSGLWAEAPPALADGWSGEVRVVERRGCDPHPVDPTSAAGRLALRSSVWPDQRERFDRLEGALLVADRVPATVDRAPVEEWLPPRLTEQVEGVVTVVFHSVVEEYLDTGARRVLHESVAAAGERATPRAPVAWLRLEPISELRHHGVRLRTWPGGEERVLAVCGAHGSDVRRPPEG
jgi:hypothetical protein